MFYGDFQDGEDAQTFLTHFEAFLTTLPTLTESEKCQRLYLHCHSGWDAEDWYEEFENSAPEILTSWVTLRKHFCVKWLGASPSTLLENSKTEPVTTTQPGAATNTSCQTTTTATDSNDATTTIEQRDNEEPTVGGEEEVKGAEKQDETGKREAERREANAGKQDRTTTTQRTHARFDWAAEVDDDVVDRADRTAD